MLAKTPKNFVDKGLVYSIDLSNPLCWSEITLNNGLKAKVFSPLPSTAIVLNEEIKLKDLGLAQRETGRAYSLREQGIINPKNGLLLVEVYKTDANNTISGITSDAGTYAELSSSYVQGYFKVEGTDYELLPARYASGMTIEMSLKIVLKNLSNENHIFYMGTRSENKFFKDYGASTGQPQSGYTTSEGIPLAPDHEDNPELGVEGNALSFLIDSDGRIGYKFIASDMKIESEFSANNITHDEWVNISFSYKPCDIITDPDLLACAAQRSGTLSIFVNGLVFHEFKDFPEFIFKPMQTEPSKQIGVPYNISWGGGTLGLGERVSLLRNENEDSTIFGEVTNNDSLLKKEFSNSINSGIQTLRIYNRPLTILEARENHNFLATRYKLPLVKGGRTTPQINW